MSGVRRALTKKIVNTTLSPVLDLHVPRDALDDGDIGSFFDASGPIDVAFRVAFHDRLAVAPRGGTGDAITVAVQPK